MVVKALLIYGVVKVSWQLLASTLENRFFYTQIKVHINSSPLNTGF